MFNSDTLAGAASATLVETTEPKLIVGTVFSAPEYPPAVAERDQPRGGVVKAEIDKPESRVGGARPEPSPKKSVPENIRYYDLKRN
jgi:hypothetical protein